MVAQEPCMAGLRGRIVVVIREGSSKNGPWP